MRSLIAPIGALLLILSLPLQAGQKIRAHAVPQRSPKIIRPAVGHSGPPRLAPSASRQSPAPPPSQTIPSDSAAQDMLRRMLQAENSLSLSGDQVTVISRNGLDISSEQQVLRNGARALRMDYLRPARLAGEQIIDNGRFYCHLIPKEDTLELSPSRIHTLRVRVPEVIKQIQSGRLVVQSAGQETVAGHVCMIIQVAARSAAPVPWRRFWVDPVNGAQLRIEQYNADGQLQSASSYTQVTYNPTLDKDAFKLPHAGGKVIERGFAVPSLTLDQVRLQAGFPVSEPTYLPDGFRFQAGSVSEGRAERSVVELRYFNGANVFSVFETPEAKTDTRLTMEHPRQGVLFGRRMGMKVVLIGNLSNAELERVMGSLH